MLRFMHGLSISETAALMGRNDDAVKRCSTGAWQTEAAVARGGCGAARFISSYCSRRVGKRPVLSACS